MYTHTRQHHKHLWVTDFYFTIHMLCILLLILPYFPSHKTLQVVRHHIIIAIYSGTSTYELLYLRETRDTRGLSSKNLALHTRENPSYENFQMLPSDRDHPVLVPAVSTCFPPYRPDPALLCCVVFITFISFLWLFM